MKLSEWVQRSTVAPREELELFETEQLEAASACVALGIEARLGGSVIDHDFPEPVWDAYYAGWRLLRDLIPSHLRRKTDRKEH